MDWKYSGNDNYGKPKTDYRDRIANLTDDELLKECESKIWLAAYAANNPRSDYHWHSDALYDECKRRDKVSIYETGFKQALKSA